MNFFKKIFGNKINHNNIEIYYDLSSVDFDKLIKIEIGEINLPTGKIIVSDPFLTDLIPPLSRSVLPGTYPVILYITEIEPEHYRVAFAKIIFKNDKVAKWILAVRDDMKMKDLKTLKDGEYFGFPVEAGLASFLDEKTKTIFQKEIDEFYKNNPNGNYYDDILAYEFKKYSSNNKYSGDIGDWNNHIVDNNSNLNVIMFASGWGDGYYPIYWGLNEKGEIVELLVDFMINFE